MARGTTGDIGHASQIVLLNQILAERSLVGKFLTIKGQRFVRRRRLIAHIEYLVTRAQVLVRRAVAVEAPLHAQRGVVVHQGHAVHLAMAGVAAHAFINVNAVIEINVIGQVVHARPFEGLASAVALPHGFEDGRIGPDLRVAVHASLGRRDAGIIRILDGSVAVATVNAYGGDMVLVAEGHWLRAHDFLIGDIGRAVQLKDGPEHAR